MKTICIIIPYFGRWPKWMPLFLRSCENNPTIDWIFFTNCKVPAQPPSNTRFVPMTWPECATLAKDRCGIAKAPVYPYKLCDFKFAYGDMFREHILDYDIIGFGDLDVIYGDLRNFLSQEVLSHELITFNKNHVSGHLTFLRNAPETTRKYKSVEKWAQGAVEMEYASLDEELGYYGIDDVYCEESYNTPLSPYTPWINGAFTFPLFWYYKNGRLYNNLDHERDFLYLHFMRYKFFWKAAGLVDMVHCDPVSERDEWKLGLDGFHPLRNGDEPKERGETIGIQALDGFTALVERLSQKRAPGGLRRLLLAARRSLQATRP